ncbi:AraC family transcriptional regulator [Pantoea deleyi]|uniref:AraC family transcriptional regulator n=1 Tax=Pantoea deleyi TaxID=470932 RepID=A0A506QSR9_9GAMM|nr:AraC family transcriptional regulator [Pantoea deleyi]ORM86352.1 AraC family transcriptional regulator [Pantoea deleyi]TPV47928.1 AraC family transcriptional regulator [Pantoea deleyi]
MRESDKWQVLAELIDHHAPEDGRHGSAIDCLFFARVSAPTEPMHFAQWASFALVAQGGKALHIGDEVLHYGPGDLLLVTLDMPVRACVTQATPDKPNLGIGIAINESRLRRYLEQFPPTLPLPIPDSERGVTVHKVSPLLVDAVIRLVRLLDHPSDIEALAPLIEQEIFYRLLTGPEGSRILNMALAERPGHRVAQAARWLRENFHQPLKIDRLASSVGMSVSSLHHHFKAVTAMTPMQYQKQLRLNEARRLMLVEKLDAGTAGYRVGYQSASQFSREYRRLYGQSPARDSRQQAVSQESLRPPQN